MTFCNYKGYGWVSALRRNFIANALGLRVSCTNPSILISNWHDDYTDYQETTYIQIYQIPKYPVILIYFKWPMSLNHISGSLVVWTFILPQVKMPQIARSIGPTRSPPGSCRAQMGPILGPWTLLSGAFSSYSGTSLFVIYDYVKLLIAQWSYDELTKDTPYLTITGKLWGVVREYFGQTVKSLI